ncbi:MAG: folate-binding protein [Xanthobacteraceae bacterium]|nr:MAG: folate-binding protein [Xanthobacteraceae bacterium]
MKAAFLSDRGVVKVSGEAARGFLNGILTTDVNLVRPAEARFGALLTPQGKIIADFCLTEAPVGHGGGFLFDCAREMAPTLAARLTFYKLRAKVEVEDLSDSLGVLAVWDALPAPAPALDLAYADPRDDRLGFRVLMPGELAAKAAAVLGATLVEAGAYEAYRIACGVPRGGIDFPYGNAFPHEANMDRLHGVDFDKGCYIGQEVVSRMQHRGTARTRIVAVQIEGPAPEPGAAITAGTREIGTMGSSAHGLGLALMRLDRAAEAAERGEGLSAGGVALRLADTQAAG